MRKSIPVAAAVGAASIAIGCSIASISSVGSIGSVASIGASGRTGYIGNTPIQVVARNLIAIVRGRNA